MSDLDNLRYEINNIDSEILYLLKKRMNISVKVGKFKKENNITILDNNREKKVYQKLFYLNEQKGEKLEEEFIKNIWEIIMNYSKKLQINDLN